MFYAQSWAQSVQDNFEAPYTVRAGWSPSGAPHPGHLQEILGGWFTACELEGAEFVVGLDDRDALCSEPSVLHDGETTRTGPFGLETDIGRPLVRVDDPFGCCSSYAQHNRRVLEQVLNELEIEARFCSMDERWENGRLDEYIQSLLEHWRQLRLILEDYQTPPPIPLRPHCNRCGRMAVGLGIHSTSNTGITYRCNANHGQGCGHEGVVEHTKATLPWRLRWPLQWDINNITFEPYGRDHQSSVQSGRAIAQHLGWQVPVLERYEWWNSDGEDFSSSSGGITLPEYLDVTMPSVVRWLGTQNPNHARSVEIEQVPDYTRRFRQGHTDEEAGALTAALGPVPDIGYTLGAHAGCLPTDEQRLGYLAAMGANGTDDERALQLIDRAVCFARRYRSEEHYELGNGTAPDGYEDLLYTLCLQYDPDADSDQWNQALRIVADEYEMGFGRLCRVLYQRLFGTTNGPRLAPLLAQFYPDDIVTYLAP